MSTCCAIHVWSETFSSEQSKGMDCKHTHPPLPIKEQGHSMSSVGEGRAERTTLKASEEGKDSVYRHMKPPARRHACDGRHMWWRTHKSTRMNLKAARQQMCEGLRNFGMCIWTELSILTVCTPKATEQNKPCKVFTMQRHCFDSTGRRPGWK